MSDMEMLRSYYSLLACPHAETRKRAHRKLAGGNSTNQRSEPSLPTRRQEDPWLVVRPRTPTGETEGNPTRIDGADRLEKAVSMASMSGMEIYQQLRRERTDIT